MKSRRRTIRKKPDTVIQVVDRSLSRQLGMIVNLTHEGLLLLSQEALSVHRIFELELVFPGGEQAPSGIYFGAESVWSDQSGVNTNYHWTGFSIIDISEETESALKRLTKDWEPDDS